MGLLGTRTQEAYYHQSQSRWSVNPNGTVAAFTLTDTYFPTLTDLIKSDIRVFVNGIEIDTVNYTFSQPTLTFTGRLGNETVLAASTFAPINGATLTVKERAPSENYGNYQYISIDDIINNFVISYVGVDKIINKVKRTDIAFHAQRALAEMSYDTLRSNKSQEIEVPPSLTMILPHDYVNYIKLSWLDNGGVERLLLPARKTSNPKALLQDSNFDYLFDDTTSALLEAKDSDTWESFKNSSATNTTADEANNGADIDKTFFLGQRFGMNPEYASSNGLFYIDNARGNIQFSSNINGKTVTLKYLSDTLGTDEEMQIHKFAEEAMYKWIAHAILATKTNVPEYIIARFKKERFAEIRKAKLRLSNLKLEELTQIMRGKSKQLKH